MTPKVPCESCDYCTDTWYCANCDSYYCESCWGRQGPHKAGKKGQDGLPHEMTSPSVLERYRAILNPDPDPERQEELHLQDCDTTWIGIDQEDNVPVFQNYGRYQTIMADSLTKEVGTRYPQIVSFIGQTGAGKSTVVKMLIDHQRALRKSSVRSFDSPVVSSLDSNVPTSADVHLYSDPGTWDQSRPVLYADCEGLEGGEIDPLAVKYRTAERNIGAHAVKKATLKKIHKVARSTRLDWATSPEKRRRQFAVTELYPRILYTFSDVIVFVLRNSKTFEQVLEKLLRWAAASIEKSVNQPLLPHAVIALNATDNAINTQQWDVNESTKTLLNDVDDAIAASPKFAKYAEYWRTRGKKVRTMKDLLECFYTSVTVVRIPSKGRYMLMNEQVGRLYHEISKACNRAYIFRQKIRMLCDADDLQMYLQCAFDHFSRNLDEPFDFSEISLRHTPIPLDFRGNILKMALAIWSNLNASTRPSGDQIFEPLSRMVASCIMLDLTRQKYQGTAIDLFDKRYLSHCVEALHNFCESYWPCSYESKNGRCANTQQGHGTKGHQNSYGKVLAVGSFQSGFEAANYEETWKNLLRDHLDKMRRDLQLETFSTATFREEDLALQLHVRNMDIFFKQCGSANKFRSHSACFCCLRETPTEPLPCRHVLCLRCIQSYGMIMDDYWVSMRHCPLHVQETTWQTPQLISLKPKHAGVRVLTLDGGGVRGIIELEVLKAIETELGGNLPIQAFFDLIVGTSTGGIIALGLGTSGWSVDHCRDTFIKLCGRAFTPRDFHGIPFFRNLAFLHHHSFYKTRPFEAALQEAFGTEDMFNSGQGYGSRRTRVAVTSATASGDKAVVIANYNRHRGGEEGYIFDRPERVPDEMQVWHAARATSAAPRYFKPFRSPTTTKEYWDGALYHNNPIIVANHERRLLWPDVAASHPDVVLSIGTGHKRPEGGETSSETSSFGQTTLEPQTSDGNSKKEWSQKPRWAQLWGVLVHRVRDILDSDRRWDDFLRDIDASSNTITQQRYQRINVYLGRDPPELDDVNQVEWMRAQTEERLKNNPKYSLQVQEVAHQLLASCFFFEKSASNPVDCPLGFQVAGVIRCRFLAGSNELRNLGNVLSGKQNGDFQPYFKVVEYEETGNTGMPQLFTLQEGVIRNMQARAEFKPQPLVVEVSRHGAKTTLLFYVSSGSGCPVSGFPRSLLDDESLELSRVSSPKSISEQPTPPPTPPTLLDTSRFRTPSMPALKIPFRHDRKASTSSRKTSASASATPSVQALSVQPNTPQMDDSSVINVRPDNERNGSFSSRSLSSQSNATLPETASVSSETSVATSDEMLRAHDTDRFDQRLQDDINLALEKSRFEL